MTAQGPGVVSIEELQESHARGEISYIEYLDLVYGPTPREIEDLTWTPLEDRIWHPVEDRDE
jgi:hypothetical protein